MFWLENVWNRRPGALLRKRSLLEWDIFSAHAAHLKETVKSALQKERTDMAVIPGGLTSQLQPLDVCLNKPFKDRIRQMWSDWICSDAVTNATTFVYSFLLFRSHLCQKNHQKL